MKLNDLDIKKIEKIEKARKKLQDYKDKLKPFVSEKKYSEVSTAGKWQKTDCYTFGKGITKL
jgi:hypothetical protein